MHPLSSFRYCPRCGALAFKEHNFKAKRCTACGFVYYFNPSAATAVFVVDHSNLLVSVRGKEPAQGTYDLPGGFVDMGETAEGAAWRELQEEVHLEQGPGLELQYLFSLPNLYLYSAFEVHTLDMFYLLRVPNVNVYAGKGYDDVQELKSVPLDKVNPEAFGLSSIRQAVSRFCAELPLGNKEVTAQ